MGTQCSGAHSKGRQFCVEGSGKQPKHHGQDARLCEKMMQKKLRSGDLVERKSYAQSSWILSEFENVAAMNIKSNFGLALLGDRHGRELQHQDQLAVSEPDSQCAQ